VKTENIQDCPMMKHQYRTGELCSPYESPRSGTVRLLHRARFVDQAWLCRNSLTHLLSVIPEASLNFVREAILPLRVRPAACGRGAR